MSLLEYMKPVRDAVGALLQAGWSGPFNSAGGMLASLLVGDGGDFVRRYQSWHGLPETGELDAATIEQLLRPRCGHPDVMPTAEAATLCRWPTGRLTWREDASLPPLDVFAVRQAFVDAFESWAAVCGVTPIYRADGPVNMLAVDGGGPADGFDAANQILALTQLPAGATKQTQLWGRYNRAQPWTADMLRAVAAHEIGHWLGLSHQPGRCLMNPYYDPAVAVPQPADVEQAQLRYGPPTQAPAPSPQTPPAKPPDPPAAGPSVVELPAVAMHVDQAGDYEVRISLTVARKPA